MNFLRNVLNGLQRWRRRIRGAVRQRPCVLRHLEQLDHRQLLSVNFTGNAVADIPDNGSPGTVIINNPNRIVPPDPALAALIKVSGFDISSIRLKYDPAMDVLDVALGQPGNQKTIPEFPVIAGDADNNLNGGTVDPAVLAVQPLFQDFPTLGGSETMAIFLDLNNDTIPDIVAGISNDPGAGKLFQVAQAIPNPLNPSTTAPAFGTPLQDHTGFAFYQDTDPTRGAFEFKIIRFSELYLEQTGTPLTATTVLGVGAFAGSADDFTPELFIRSTPVTFGVEPPSDECPPLSPPVLVNPHQHRHVNIAHPNFVRVTIFGTSGFDVRRIDNDSVRFGGAEPTFFFRLRANRDEFLDVTYVFRGDELDFPPGQQFAAITGIYNDPTTGQAVPFESGKIIFVRDASSFSAADRVAQERRLARLGDPLTRVPEFIARRAQERRVDLVLGDINPAGSSAESAATVRVRRRIEPPASSASSPVVAPRGPAAWRRRAAVAAADEGGSSRVGERPATVRIKKSAAAAPGWASQRLDRAVRWDADLDELAAAVAAAR
ncbi:MAG: hypothetical protein KatS3mg108_1778 [Isosphaeraceae bacterium]|jgi:hypothetical protein|nr:MAG: hypothetical protein KatS3mg108_1778 [Isosphaeraceae bacterium]